MLHLSVKNKPIDIKQRLGLFSCALIFLIFLLPLSLLAQTQSNVVDSLDQLLADQPVDSIRVDLLNNKTEALRNSHPDKAIQVAEEAIVLAEAIDYKKGLGYAYKNKGMVPYVKGDYTEALVDWKKSLALFEEINFKLGISNLQNNIGSVYQTKGDDPTALEYFLESYKNAEEIDHSLRIATALVNIGTVYSNEPSSYDQALEAYTKALDMFRDMEYDYGIAASAINIGEVYVKKGEPELSLDYLEESLEVFKKIGEDYSLSLNLLGTAYSDLGNKQLAEEYFKQAIDIAGINESKMQKARAHIALAELSFERRRFNQAINNYEAGLDLAQTTGLYRDQRDTYEGLARVYSALGDFQKAFEYQREFARLRDTIRDDRYEEIVGNLRFQFDLENKEKEIQLLNAENELSQVQIDRDAKAKMFLYITLGLFLAIIAGVIYQLLYIRNSNKKLAFERNKSEQILLNILPKETADELKEHGQIKAKQFESITVLFTDFKEFSLAAEEMPADALVKSVDFYFKAFDEITERHNLEKIKTIGDSYMCAGGLPTKNDTHAQDAYNAAVEMLDFVTKVLNDPPQGVHPFEVRIGLNTGPVVAGVVGIKKFAYDIWGSTVNIASRMESSSIPGKINVSENTYQLLKDKHQFTYRGEIEVKNKQLLKMYFAEEEAAVVV